VQRLAVPLKGPKNSKREFQKRTFYFLKTSDVHFAGIQPRSASIFFQDSAPRRQISRPVSPAFRNAVRGERLRPHATQQLLTTDNWPRAQHERF
jgi:hypothetical protein